MLLQLNVEKGDEILVENNVNNKSINTTVQESIHVHTVSSPVAPNSNLIALFSILPFTFFF